MALYLIILPLLAAGSAVGSVAPVAASTTGSSGVLCTTSSSPNASFSLTAMSGYINMPDGNTIFNWSYAASGGAFQYESDATQGFYQLRRSQ